MKGDDQTFFDFVRVLRKRARPAAIAAFAVLIAMTCLVFLLPTIYESRATMLIEQLDAQIDLAAGAGTREYVEQRLQRTRQLVLSDEGPGLSADQLERIFERFVRHESSPRKDVSTGAGLGLAICRGIAELHGGTIKAQNRTERAGLRVVVDLPAAGG